MGRRVSRLSVAIPILPCSALALSSSHCQCLCVACWQELWMELQTIMSRPLAYSQCSSLCLVLCTAYMTSRHPIAAANWRSDLVRTCTYPCLSWPPVYCTCRSSEGIQMRISSSRPVCIAIETTHVSAAHTCLTSANPGVAAHTLSQLSEELLNSLVHEFIKCVHAKPVRCFDDDGGHCGGA